jgi:hypothetical protein
MKSFGMNSFNEEGTRKHFTSNFWQGHASLDLLVILDMLPNIKILDLML